MRKKGQKAFYDSTRWKKCRATYLADHPYCERCKANGVLEVAVHVHHIRYLQEEDYNNPFKALNPDNLEALCFNCHQQEHHGSSAIDDSLYFDENGDIAERGRQKA